MFVIDANMPAHLAVRYYGHGASRYDAPSGAVAASVGNWLEPILSLTPYSVLLGRSQSRARYSSLCGPVAHARRRFAVLRA